MPTTSSKPSRTRVLIADDNRFMRDKVVQLLGQDFEVIGTAADGNGACEAVQLLQPEIAVLDISMPGLSGIEAVGKIKASRSESKVIFLTVHDDPDFVRAALSAGGSGYVVKAQMATDLPVAIRSALEGRLFISPCVALNGENIEQD